MFPVGALNPVPYNTRREQLVQQLVNQLQQRRNQVAQQAVTPAAGYFDFQRKRQQMTNSMSAPTHPAGAGQATAMTALTAANNVPGFLMGGFSAPNPNFSSPSAGAPVPNSPGGSAYNPALQGGAVPAGGPFSTSGAVPVPGYNQQAGAPVASQTMYPGGVPPVFQSGAPGLVNLPGNVVPVGGGAYINPVTGGVYGGHLIV